MGAKVQSNWKILSKKLKKNSSKNGAKTESKNGAKTESKNGAKTESKNGAKTESKNGAKTEIESKISQAKVSKKSFGAENGVVNIEKIQKKKSNNSSNTAGTESSIVPGTENSNDCLLDESEVKNQLDLVQEIMLQQSVSGPQLDLSDEEDEEDEKSASKKLNQKNAGKLGKYVAIDCEMVGCGSGGLTSMLARCSLVNYHGNIIYDEYVIPQEEVKDYRTSVSGITPAILKKKGKDFKVVQKEVAALLKGKIIVGHALKNDLNALMLDHPGKLLRDTARYKPLKHEQTKQPQSLKFLAQKYLKRIIQTGQHSSIEDAKAAMDLYKIHKNDWEQHMWKRQITLKPHSW